MELSWRAQVNRAFHLDRVLSDVEMSVVMSHYVLISKIHLYTSYGSTLMWEYQRTTQSTSSQRLTVDWPRLHLMPDTQQRAMVGKVQAQERKREELVREHNGGYVEQTEQIRS